MKKYQPLVAGLALACAIPAAPALADGTEATIIRYLTECSADAMKWSETSGIASVKDKDGNVDTRAISTALYAHYTTCMEEKGAIETDAGDVSDPFGRFWKLP